MLIKLTDLGHHRVDVNPADIVSLRDVVDEDLVGAGAKCIVNTVDGKHIVVIETCDEVRRLSEAE